MLKAVTNRDFPVLEATLRDLFGIALEYDPSLPQIATGSRRELLVPGIRKDPVNGIRCLRSYAAARHMAFRAFRAMMKAMMRKDPYDRIRIIYVDETADLAFGMAPGTNVIGFNMSRHRLIFVAVPDEIEAISAECEHKPGTMDSYLLAVTLHELYENLTRDVRHCRNPGKCINSICRLYENGTCCVCMGGMIDRKLPGLTLQDLYCEEDLAELKKALSAHP